VNGFVSTYACEQRPLTKARVPDAIAVLDAWKALKGVEGDYVAAREALELFDVLGLRGAVYYIEDKPVGWCLGERLAKGRMFAIHFEKRSILIRVSINSSIRLLHSPCQSNISTSTVSRIWAMKACAKQR